MYRFRCDDCFRQTTMIEPLSLVMLGKIYMPMVWEFNSRREPV
jgi:hypothetical protein